MAITTQHRTLPLGGVSVSQRTLNDGTDDIPAHAAILQGDPDFGLTPFPCIAATDNVVKASKGTLYFVTATGTGTAGTVAFKDGGTTYFTATIPAAAGIYPIPIPVQGSAHATNIHIVTSGTGVTAVAWAV